MDDIIDIKMADQLEDDSEIESELKTDSSKFSDAVIWGTDWTTESIAGQLEKGNIDLSPSFQRRDAWSNPEKSKLIESLMLGIPVPPIILAERKGKRNSFFVIDGKQRLLSIRRFFSTENKDQAKEGEYFEPLKLNGLEVLTNLNGKTYDSLKGTNNEYLDNLENSSIRTIIIKNWPDEGFLYTVFLRLNTGSKRLSPQELRQALIPGPFLTYLDEKTSESVIIQKMLGNTKPDSRMRDVELALRYYGFKCYLNFFEGNLKEFLDNTCRKINTDWESNQQEINDLFVELESSISFAYEIVENNSPFSRYISGNSNNRFNKNIFELFTFYFSDEKIRELVKENKAAFLEGFKAMNDDPDFRDAVSGTTKDIKKLSVRFGLFWKVLSQLRGAENIECEHISLVDNHLVVDRRFLR